MDLVVVRTLYAYKAFQETAAQMTQIDYDLREIEAQLFYGLRLPAEQSEKYLQDWHASHRYHGSFNCQVTDDGLVLDRALDQLEAGVKQALTAAKLYDPAQGLGYAMVRRLGLDVVLQRLPEN